MRLSQSGILDCYKERPRLMQTTLSAAVTNTLILGQAELHVIGRASHSQMYQPRVGAVISGNSRSEDGEHDDKII